MQTTEPTGHPHRNHGLFSDHYLNVTLPGRPDWAALAGEAEATMAEVSRVLDAYAPSQNEAQTEEDLVRPVLRLLGHEGTYEVQPPLRAEDAAGGAYGDAPDERAHETIILYRGDEDPRGGPLAWWAEQRRAIVRAMRESYESGLMLTGDLEYLREQATVQELLAIRRELSTSPA